GINGQPTQASYAAAKEAIRGITRVAANEWGEDGINVNNISPIALTQGVEQWRENCPERYEDTVNKIPRKRMANPEYDSGRIPVFLASEDSVFIAVQTTMSDCGATMISYIFLTMLE